jgi:hypothetical protein
MSSTTGDLEHVFPTECTYKVWREGIAVGARSQLPVSSCAPTPHFGSPHLATNTVVVVVVLLLLLRPPAGCSSKLVVPSLSLHPFFFFYYYY